MSSHAFLPDTLSPAPTRERFPAMAAARRRGDAVFTLLCLVAFALVVLPLASILWTVFARGADALTWSVFTEVTNGISGGLLNAIEGTLVLSLGALAWAAPAGVAAGIYLAEHGHGAWAAIVRFLADVLVGVPSIVLGYVSYITMVVWLGWQFSVLAGVITLGVLVLPYIVRFTELSMRQNPPALRESAYALGCREYVATLRILLPAARSGVVTGILLSLAISVGETAPLIYTVGWSNYLWTGRLTQEPIGYLTYVIWSFINQPFPSAHALAYAAAVLVVAVVLAIKILARVLLRRRGG
ncbi:phosphate ABC transporter permease PstA [Bordetella genomosp. 11]|uniref:Phosphate transport system permease protein PstA n=1 Tax=Bordetella genomosp. 11 TaxID=1416808 RepID=A0A261URF2_9BORD|nr:phosphate ABC transporter permease PstA [Bordetella genomosp. 11]OZI64474.1 phosphate ABC transporter, permease protein PstA [Bordetella genomosp. 11]